jgi:Tol biopolymer transport system component
MPIGEVDMGYSKQGAALWRLLTSVVGLCASGCSLYSLPQQRYAAFDISPRGDQIVFVGAGLGETDLYLLQLSDLQVTRIAQTPDYEDDPAFSPDGRSVVYAASAEIDHPRHLFIRSLNGKPPKQLTSGEQSFDWMPSFSRDGSRIAFARAHRHRPYSMGGYTWDHWDVYVMNADGTNLRRITRQNYSSLSRPQLSGDGATVIFSTYASERYDLFEASVNGIPAPKPLTTDGHGSGPGLSRDGKQIAFVSDRAKAFNLDLYLMDPDGTNVRRVTDNKSYNEQPVFSPDGHRILFLSITGSRGNGRYSLWEVDTESGRLKQIADPSLFDAPLKWKPQEGKRAASTPGDLNSGSR